jgi:hypothetical protein
MSEHEPTVTEQLQNLSSLHDSVLSKISDRTSSIDDRLRGWDEYRVRQDDLFIWMRDVERQKQGLNLRHVRVDGIQEVLNEIQVTIQESHLKSENVFSENIFSDVSKSEEHFTLLG